MNPRLDQNKVWRSRPSVRNKPAATRNTVTGITRIKNIFEFIKTPKSRSSNGGKSRKKIKVEHSVISSKAPNSVFDRLIQRMQGHALPLNKESQPDSIQSPQSVSSSGIPISQRSVPKSRSSLATGSSSRKRSDAGPTDTFKVFQPDKGDPIFSPVNTAKASLYQTKLSSLFKTKTFQFGFKSIKNIKPSIKPSPGTSLLHQLNYYLQKFRVFDRFNRTMLIATVSSLTIFFLYLCFFDTFFIVKDYRVTFAQSSYLSPTDVEKVVGTIKEDKLLGFIPNNQFWYLGSRSMTIAAQNKYPEVESIKVKRKIWPNYAEIEVKTEPILITLGINKSEYWRIGYDGTVVSKDDAGLRQNLVIVERPVTFNQPDATLQDYSFAGNCGQDSTGDIQSCLQLNRFWFVVWVWNILDQLKIEPTKTILPSLFDSDVIIELKSGSRIIFDAGTMSMKVQRDRIVSVLGSIIGSQVDKGEIKYIDFRQPKKVYLCRSGQPCAK